MSLKHKIIHEIKRVALITTFFFIGFNFLVLIYALLAPNHREMTPYFIGATIAALVVGKVMVILESLVVDHWFKKSSFLGVVIKKTLLFSVIIILVMILEEVLHGVISEDLSFSEAWNEVWAHASGPLFLGKTLYLIILFSLYSFLFEMDKFFGMDNLLDIVLSRFRKPKTEEKVVMSLSWLGEQVEAQPALVQEVYRELAHIVPKHKGHIISFSPRQTLLVWSIEEGRDELAPISFYLDLQDHLKSQARDWQDRYGTVAEVKAGVGQGDIKMYEVGGYAKREILKEGIALDEARALDAEARGASIFFDESFREVLKKKEIKHEEVPRRNGKGFGLWTLL